MGYLFAKRGTSPSSGESYSRRVGIQSICYLSVYFITWTPISSARIIQYTGGVAPRWLLLLGAFFASFQGVLNCLVYFRPKILNYWSKHPELSFCGLCCRIPKRIVARASIVSSVVSVTGTNEV